jgi:GNAT superfamily N-acetyltransferase
MIGPALPEHFALIYRLLCDGAACGSFDGELTTGSLAAQFFFANLSRMLRVGRFLTIDSDGRRADVAAHGYVYAIDGAQPPIGFALLKSAGDSTFELWLAAIERAWRGRGHGTAMIRAVLATPAGRLAQFVRVKEAGVYAPLMRSVLTTVGYHGDTPQSGVRRFVRG